MWLNVVQRERLDAVNATQKVTAFCKVWFLKKKKKKKRQKRVFWGEKGVFLAVFKTVLHKELSFFCVVFIASRLSF